MAWVPWNARTGQIALIVVGALIVAAAASCDQSTTGADDLGSISKYQLCPKVGDARTGLDKIAKSFAAKQRARVFERGAEAQRELAGMESRVLETTGLPLVLLTIEKPEHFRISITNAGLKEKFALSVRQWNVDETERETQAFLNEVGRFWSIEEVRGGVTDDPPCSKA